MVGVVESEWITVVDGDKDGSAVCLLELTGDDNLMWCWPWKKVLVGADIGVIVGEWVEMWFNVGVTMEGCLISVFIEHNGIFKSSLCKDNWKTNQILIVGGLIPLIDQCR